AFANSMRRSTGAGLPRSSASFGSNVSKRAACRGFSAWPLRRPKNARCALFRSSPDSCNVADPGNSDSCQILESQSDIARTHARRYQLRAKWPGRDRRLPHRAANCGGEIGPFPGEAAVLVWRAAEMPVGRGALVDRSVELESATDVGGGEPEQLWQNFLKPFLFDLARAVS